MASVNTKAIAVGVILAIGSAIAVASAQTQLIYGSFLPAPHIVHKKALEPFFERVEEDTGGSLSWELVPGGALGGTLEALQVISDGVVDSGIVLDVYLRNELPITSTFADLIVLPDDFMVYAAAANEMQLIECEECIAERARKDVTALAYYAPSPYLLMCTSDVKNAGQLDGKKVRAGSRLAPLVESFGATAVTITSTEVYTALQRGQAECTIASAAWLVSYSLMEVVDSIIKIPMGSYFNAMLLGMNAQRLESLSEEQKRVIVRNLPGLVADALYAYKAQAKSALDNAAEKGIAIYEPGQELTEALAKFRQKEIERAIEHGNSIGLERTKGRIGTYLDLVEKWRKIFDGIDSQTELEEALWNEVFSKLEL